MTELNIPLKPAEFEKFRDLIHKNSGIFLDDYKADGLTSTLGALMRQRDIESYEAYYELLTKNDRNKDEFKRLMDLVTVNETCFFRNPGQFEALRTVVLPELVKQKEALGQHTIRVWSAGCSTGEEPYSIAMTLLEFLPDPKSWRIDILATDVSNNVLNGAQKAVYRSRALRETPDYYKEKYFTRTATGDYVLDKQVCDMVSFNYHNLITESYPMLVLGGWDMIFCRNVMIYFKLDNVRKVIADFYNALRDGGYLFIGHAETLYRVNDQFTPMHIGGAYVYKKDIASLVRDENGGMSTAAYCVIDSLAGGKPDLEPKARQEFRRVADKEAQYATAYERFSREEFEEAARLAARLVKADPEHTDARILLANIYMNQGRAEKALVQVNEILDRMPLSPKGHYLLGMIREREGRVDEAIREFKRVIYIDSGFALAHLNLANIYKAKNMAAEAVTEYNNAIAALALSPRGDWVDFAGGFMGDVLLEVCKRNMAQLTG